MALYRSGKGCRTWKQVCRGVAAVALAGACALFAYALTRSPVFAGEGHEYSLGASSSAQIVQTDDPFFKLFRPVAGESARFDGDIHAALLAQFRARVLFEEEACGVVNYYCYSPLLGTGVMLCGREVNLHIAVRGERTTAGTPVIFGGV